MSSIYGYYHFDGFKVDVFGYDKDTDCFDYSVENEYGSKVRRAKSQYKSPDKRNEWKYPCGTYIYIISPIGKKHRLFLG